MASDAMGLNAHKARTGQVRLDTGRTAGEQDACRLLAHQGACQSGNRIGHGATVNLDQGEVGPGNRLLGPIDAMEDALLATDQREVRIGGEEEGRRVEVLEVPLDISHRGLLVVAHDAAERVGQLLSRLLHQSGKEVGRIEREDERALVVEHATAQQIAVTTRDVERGNGPTDASGHDVGVCDGRNLRLALALEVGVSDVALAVVGIQAQTPCHGQTLAQGLIGGRTPRLARFGMGDILHRIDSHKPRDVCDHVLPDFIDIGIHLRFELFVYHLCTFSGVISSVIGVHILDQPRAHRVRLRAVPSRAHIPPDAQRHTQRSDGYNRRPAASAHRLPMQGLDAVRKPLLGCG